jgi:hypothetical protein
MQSRVKVAFELFKCAREWRSARRVTETTFFWLGGRVECNVGDIAHLQPRELRRRCCASSCGLSHELWK